MFENEQDMKNADIRNFQNIWCLVLAPTNVYLQISDQFCNKSVLVVVVIPDEQFMKLENCSVE